MLRNLQRFICFNFDLAGFISKENKQLDILDAEIIRLDDAVKTLPETDLRLSELRVLREELKVIRPQFDQKHAELAEIFKDAEKRLIEEEKRLAKVITEIVEEGLDGKVSREKLEKLYFYELDREIFDKFKYVKEEYDKMYHNKITELSKLLDVGGTIVGSNPY